MMEGYKSWVRRNRQWISSFESLANTLTWFLPERFANSELTPEAVSTLLGLVTVMNQHIIETTPRPRNRGGLPHQLLPQEPERDQSFPWSLCISVMKEVELLTEMAAEHYLGKDKKWGPVASIEAVKVLFRLLILQKSGYKMLLDGGESKNIADPTGRAIIPEQENVHGQAPSVRPDPKNPALQSRANRESLNSGFYPRDLEGRAMQAMHKFSENVGGPSRPSWIRQRQNSESMVQQPAFYNPRSAFVESKQGYANRVFVAGEVLLITRPLLYVLLVWRYGLKTWRPWVSALSVDLVGMYLVTRSTSSYQTNIQSSSRANLQRGAHISLSTLEVQELRRRQLRWALYAMRNPFFDRYTRRPLEKVENILAPVPILGMLAGKAIELLLAVQGFYSYTSAS